MPLSEKEELELLQLEEEEHQHQKAAQEPKGAALPLTVTHPSGETKQIHPSELGEAQSKGFALRPENAPKGGGRALVKNTLSALPIAGAVGGGILGSGAGPAGTLGGGGLGYAGGKELEGLGNHYLLGEELPPTNPVEQAKRVAQNVGEGAAMEATGQVGGALAAGAPSVAKFIASKARRGAEGLANIASGVSKAKVLPNTGAELLDREVVQPLSFRGGIQKRAEEAVGKAAANEEEALASVPGGVTRTPLLASIDKKISELRRIPGNEIQIKRLERIKDSFSEQPNFKKYSASDLNQIGKNYSGRAGSEEISPVLEGQEKGLIEAGNPEAGEVISKARATQRGLQPVAEGGKENVVSGLATDAGLFGAGEAYDALTGHNRHSGIALAAARRFGKTPAASTGAVASNAISKAANAFAESGGPIAQTAGKLAGYAGAQEFTKSENPHEDSIAITDPRLDAAEITQKLSRRQANALSNTKYANIMTNAAKRGGDSVATTHFLLSQSDPEYQALMKKAQER